LPVRDRSAHTLTESAIDIARRTIFPAWTVLNENILALTFSRAARDHALLNSNSAAKAWACVLRADSFALMALIQL